MALAAALPAVAVGAAVADGGARTWTEVKCDRYVADWARALAQFGTAGLGHAFLADHAAFLASGCGAGRSVCPRSPEEFALANAMVVLAMNAGAASTFPPFACRD